ncbi:MAG: hemerythrin domain-containing protein [Armatimonadota bacterium]
MEPRSPFGELADDHMALVVDMGDLQGAVRRLNQPSLGTLDSGNQIADMLDAFQWRLRVHFRREEEGVFPEAHRIISEGSKGADVFGRFFGEEAEDDMSAHSALARRVNEMTEIAAHIASSGASDQAAARRLLALVNLTANLLQRHADKEDRLIFPMIENSLTPEQVGAVRDRLRQIPTERDLGGPGEELGQLGG